MSDVVTHVVENRDERYGDTPFRGRALRSQHLKAVIHGSPFYNNLTWEEKEALDMIAHKIARIIGGEQDRGDSWIDIAGYARLVFRDVYEKQDNGG